MKTLENIYTKNDSRILVVAYQSNQTRNTPDMLFRCLVVKNASIEKDWSTNDIKTEGRTTTIFNETCAMLEANEWVVQ